MTKLLTYISILCFVVLTSCTSTKKLTSTNLSSMYSGSVSNLAPKYLVYHDKDLTSTIFFQIDNSQLGYSNDAKKGIKTASVKVKYLLYNSFESETILDSATYYIDEDKSGAEANYITGDFSINAKKGNKYLLRIITKDLIGKQRTEKFIEIDKTNNKNRQNFYLTNAQGRIIYDYYITEKEPVILHYNSEDATQLFARVYVENFKLPPPPFSIYTPQPFDYYAVDSLYTIPLLDGTGRVESPKKGFVHVVTEEDSKTGITLFKYPSQYPKLPTITDLAEPLRFITNKKEYEKLIEGEKKTMDEFWLDNAVSEKRAKELIQHYYNRVEYANLAFSSYDKGWRTDRGMIYLVLGPPNIVYKNSNTESWVYGEENNYMSINLVFSKVQNPFTDNDYRLGRSSIYKSHWYRAVDSWRQGRVFLNN